MAVVNTTSPCARTGAPNASPRYVEPSSSTSSASGNGHLDLVHEAASGDRRNDFALQPHARERSILALRCEALRLHGPFSLRIEHDDIGGRSGGERADTVESAIERECANGCEGHAFDELLQRHPSFVDEAHAQPECGLETADAERCVVELAELLDQRVRRVVRRAAIDGAVDEAVDARLD